MRSRFQSIREYLKKPHRPLFWYSLGFLLAMFLVFGGYIFTGRSFVWERDGWLQHYKALVYYGRYLRSFFVALFTQGKFTPPSYDFAIGEGAGVLETLHFYGIGDPFTVLSVLVPSKLTVFYYMFTVLLRLYLAGLALMAFLQSVNLGTKQSRILAALAYVFSYWGILNAVRHPFFLNPLIYLPLLLLGVEKVVAGKKNRSFPFVVMIAALSHFYFFYMEVIITVLYTLVRLYVRVLTAPKEVSLVQYHRWRSPTVLKKQKAADTPPSAASILARLFCFGLLGVLLALPVLAPIIRVFLSDSRTGVQYSAHYLYPLKHFAKLVHLLLSSGDSYWACMGFPLPFFFCLILLFRRRKQYSFLTTCTILCGILLSSPILGRLMNGFSYATNRWSFALAMLAAVLLAIFLPELEKLSEKEFRGLLIALIIYTVLNIALIPVNGFDGLLNVALLLFLMIILSPSYRKRFEKESKEDTETVIETFEEDLENSILPPIRTIEKKERKKLLPAPQMVLIGSIFLSFLVNGLRLNSPLGMNYRAECVPISEAMSMMDHLEADDILALEQENGISNEEVLKYRYSGTALSMNENMLSGMSSTQYYWSLGNPSISSYRDTLHLQEYPLYKYNGYSGREGLLALSSARYYITENASSYVPLGYKPIGPATGSDGQIYRSEYAFPMVWSSYTWVPYREWSTHSSAQMEWALMRTIALESPTPTSKKNPMLPYPFSLPKVEMTDCYDNVEHINFTITNEKNLKADGLKITVYEPDAEMTLQIPPTAGKCLYVSLGRVFATHNTPYYLEEEDGYLTKAYFSVFDEPEQFIQFASDDYAYYNGRDIFSVYLGYHEEPVTEIKVRFQRKGTYYFVGGSIEAADPAPLYAAAATRRSDAWDYTISTDTITAKGSMREAGFVFFAIPYSEHWTATVNNNLPTKVYRANGAYMAVPVPEWAKKIELTYHR